MTIAKGVSLGPYEIVAHIGAGGMGDVWRARDSRIGREVAVKILPESYGDGDERLRRFEQEARAAGALNHPGLVTIFDVGTTGGSPYIVMELLEGQTLRDAIGRQDPQPLPVRKAIDYGNQIASALAVAHEKGIIHRDLKPENLFITTDDRVKILDFGLAKLAADAPESDRTHTQRHLTSAGIVVGTPGYMSPEQARAQPLDARTDIFSFGTVMYEMVTGRCPFDSESAVETMHAVLALDPPLLSTFVENVPPALEAIVRHCMEKQPRDRFQSARDLAFQLRTLMPEMQGSLTAGRQSRVIPLPRVSRRTVLTTIGALAIAGAAGFALYRVRTAAAPGETAARTFRQLTYADGLEAFPTLAPDGKSFAFVSAQSGNRDIYVQRVDGRIPIDITSDSPDDDSEPAFSPDGSQIAFRSERNGGGIFVMGVTGESVRRLTNEGHNPAWSPDGTRIVYSTLGVELRPHVHRARGILWVVDVRTQARRQLLKSGPAGETGHGSDDVQPSWSPHGKRIAFWGESRTGTRDIWTFDPDAANPNDTIVRVVSDSSLHWNPTWSPDGNYLYFGSDRDGTLNLWRIPMDEDRGTPAGSAEPLSLPAPLSGHYAFAQNGDLAFTTMMRSYRLLAVPFDASSGKTGEPRPLVGGNQEILTFEPSPDGQTIAFTTAGAREDVFVMNADGTRLRQLTNDDARDRGVTWSPDGTTLYFYSNRDGGTYHIWSIRSDGSALTRITDPREFERNRLHNLYLPNASPDGRTLAAQSANAVFLVHLDRPIAQRIEKFADNLNSARWSPDGKRLLARNQTTLEFVVLSALTRRVEHVLKENSFPRWLVDGRHVAFFDDQRVGILDVETGQTVYQPLPRLEGVEIDNISPRFSNDGTMMYMIQVREEGDIWMMQVRKE